MFCRNCGTEMSDNARFCPKCGFERVGVETPQNKEIVEDNTIKFKLKPEFNLPYKTITTIGTALLYVLCFMIIFLDSLELFEDYPGMLVIVIGILIVYVIIKLIFESMQYKKLEYNFYATKVEYIDGFFNKEEKELKYKYVREVTMSQNILERMFDIGTIRVFTNASSGGYGSSNNHNMMGKNGIYIHCVKDVKDKYQQVKQIIDEGTQNS